MRLKNSLVLLFLYTIVPVTVYFFLPASNRCGGKIVSLCLDETTYQTVRYLMYGLPVVSWLVILGITLVSLWAQRRPMVAMVLFDLVFYVGHVFAAFATVGNAYMLLSVAWALPVLSITVLGFGMILAGTTIYALYAIIRSALVRIQGNQSIEVAQVLSPQDAPDLAKLVAEIAAKMGVPVPRNTIVGMSASFYATASAVNPMADVPKSGKVVRGETLYLSLPMCHILSVDELAAVIAHELSHFQLADVKRSLVFSRAYLGIASAVERLYSDMDTHMVIKAVVSPIRRLLVFSIRAFEPAVKKLRHRQEFVADAAATTLSGPNMGFPLAKLIAIQEAWQTTCQATRYRNYTEDEQPMDHIGRWFDTVLRYYKDHDWQSIFLAQKLDKDSFTHPSTRERLQRMGIDVAQLTPAQLNPHVSIKANSLIPNFDQIEAQLSQRIMNIPEWMLFKAMG